jgi:hypothetical protein
LKPAWIGEVFREVVGNSKMQGIEEEGELAFDG